MIRFPDTEVALSAVSSGSFHVYVNPDSDNCTADLILLAIILLRYRIFLRETIVIKEILTPTKTESLPPVQLKVP